MEFDSGALPVAGANPCALIAVTPDVTIRRVAVSSMDNNIYLLTAVASGHQILIDAADDMAKIGRLLRAASRDAPQPTLRAIITTHSHRDHIRALGALAAATSAPILAGRDDVAAIERQVGVRVKQPLDHGDKVRSGGLTLDVIGLRGHTPGSIALAYGEDGQPTHLFTGDSLFPGGVGNTDRDPARFGQLLGDVVERVFAVYPDSTIVHPGHGAPTTLGAERPRLAEWRARGW
ncbi:MAG: MBL fold metallo-hydrolase [Bifidobacteriaceae bacterium]|jgi:glyoxylase-like metal-dependent hydrolase (beta-lactamase superfamily II)|nr:MBL fold metallo-hydrolase [Bifidobacteriaceae bacterium]